MLRSTEYPRKLVVGSGIVHSIRGLVKLILEARDLHD